MKVRRVVAGLHPQRPPGDGIEAIAELARSMEAELLGLFIEDAALLHFAALPFAREIGAASATRRAVDLAAMERFMRERAAQLRGHLEEVLGTHPLPWSFRVARGTIAQQLLAAAIESPGPTLLLPPGASLGDAPLVVTITELDEARLCELLAAERPILILPDQASSA
ncbi:MAG: hypothetical protein AB1452_09055 [Pseudomonadota bacterium]